MMKRHLVALLHELEEMMRGSNRLLAGAVIVMSGMWASACDDAPPPPAEQSALASESGFCRELAKTVCNDKVVSNCYASDDKSLSADTAKCVQAVAQPMCNDPSCLTCAAHIV
jgi:hypothetical protein